MSIANPVIKSALRHTARNLSSAIRGDTPTPRYIKLIVELLADHQRTAPHHADMCALCIEAKAALTAAGAA